MAETPHSDSGPPDEGIPSSEMVGGDVVSQRLRALELANQMLAEDPANETAQMMRDAAQADLDRLQPPPPGS